MNNRENAFRSRQCEQEQQKEKEREGEREKGGERDTGADQQQEQNEDESSYTRVHAMRREESGIKRARDQVGVYYQTNRIKQGCVCVYA